MNKESKVFLVLIYLYDCTTIFFFCFSEIYGRLNYYVDYYMPLEGLFLFQLN